MTNFKKNLRERCHVNGNGEGDSFVGVKANTEDVVIYFPIGYQLPDNDDDLRCDVHNLFGILAAFMKEDLLIESSKSEVPKTVDFPMHAYLKVIRNFLRTGRYYIETDPKYHTATKGKTSWPKTLKEQRALVQKNGSLIFTNRTVRVATPNANKEITQIHNYCVYEAFNKLGWIYVPFMPEKPGHHPSVKESVAILTKKILSTQDDKDQELFNSMKAMLTYIDEKSSDRQYFFGTDYFERIWEKMIDKAFGSEGKNKYFPKTRWLLDFGIEKDKIKTPLYPDSIMIFKDKYYVLDAKLYRYGWSFNPDHLPNGSDINKQITYGEYIERAHGISDSKLYNAFIMPFNKEDNLFQILDEDGNIISVITGDIGNVGEAVGEWKPNVKNYERIQGIVIDTRYLMYNYVTMSDVQKEELAECIGKVDNRKVTPVMK